MGADSKIEWTDSSWNPIRGCSRVSPGCGGPGPHGGCYAEAMAARFSKKGQWGHGFAEMVKGNPRWTGKVELIESQLDLPRTWKTPRKIFVNSTSDLFHKDIPEESLARVFNVMADTPHHTYQILTKRADRMREVMCGPKRHDLWSPKLWHRRRLPNVWFGVSVEDQERANERIPDLLLTPAAVRFLSCEPLLGPIRLDRVREVINGFHIDDALTGFCSNGHGGIDGPKLDWVIVGGESGPRARPMHPDWARALRDQCAAAGVAFFFKQHGEFVEAEPHDADEIVGIDPEISEHDCAFDNGAAVPVRRVGKKNAGRLLDGREHNEFPTAGAA